MATRSSGRGEDRSNARNASGGTNASAKQSTSSGGDARQAGGSAMGSSAPRSTTGGGSANTPAGATTRTSNTESRSAASQGQSNASTQNRAGGSDRERELSKTREQGSVRFGSPARGQDVGQDASDYSPSVHWAGGNSPFAMMRRMMDDMDRLFSDFSFTQPGLLTSSFLRPEQWLGSEPRQRALGGQTQSGGTTGSSLSSRGQQGLQRGAQRGQSQALQSLWAPQIEVLEKGNNLVIRADLPGLSREDVDVEIEEDSLIIRGERHSDVEDEGEGYYRSERSYGSFYRAIPLPDGIDPSACNATFKDGVLEVTLPKPAQQPSRARKIDVR